MGRTAAMAASHPPRSVDLLAAPHTIATMIGPNRGALARKVWGRTTAILAASALMAHAACSDDDVAPGGGGGDAGLADTRAVDTGGPDPGDAGDGAVPCLDDQ